MSFTALMNDFTQILESTGMRFSPRTPHNERVRRMIKEKYIDITDNEIDAVFALLLLRYSVPMPEPAPSTPKRGRVEKVCPPAPKKMCLRSYDMMVLRSGRRI